jgi:transposase
MRDMLDTIYADTDFLHLFPAHGKPGDAPWRLALVTLFQFAENLSDRRAADAVRARIDWKYALSLDLTDPGFDHTVLSEFRSRLVDSGAESLLFDLLLAQFRQRGLLTARGRQRTDSTHVLAAIRALNRFEVVGETLRHALNVLATVAPDWLRIHSQPEWVERYARRSEDDRLPSTREARQALAETIGADGFLLLTIIFADAASVWLRVIPAVETLRRVWVQNYLRGDDGVHWRTAEDVPPAARFISSPYDDEAHLAKKGSTCWVGYKVHLTETCEDDGPHLITHVATTAAPTADGDVTPRIHQDLAAQGLLPTVHLVDTGFLDAELLVVSEREYGVTLLGPTRKDPRWQTRAAAGFGVEHFVVDWERQRAICPAGKVSLEWVPRIDNRGNESIYIRFSPSDCGPCPSRANCTRSTAKHPRRSISIRPREQYEALQRRREDETTSAYKREYAKRAGIEGTISQGVRRAGMRRSRYIGLAKTSLGHLLTAAALNFVRVANWFAEVPRAQTRQSPFTILMAA